MVLAKVDAQPLDCDPMDVNSCTGAGDYCWLNVTNEENPTACAPVGITPPPQQNEACEFINGCDIGLACALAGQPGLLCTHVCDPVTGETALGGTCQDVPELPAETALCARLDEYYTNVNLSYGICVDCAMATETIACDRLFADSFESI